MNILHWAVISDHLPIAILNVENIPMLASNIYDSKTELLDCSSLLKEDIATYFADKLLSNINLHCNTIRCIYDNCND